MPDGQPQPVVVGVDGSRSAVHAVEWAAVEARNRHAPLKLVHTFVVPNHGYPDFIVTVGQVRAGMQRQGRDWLSQATEAATTIAPDLSVDTELREANTIPTLLDESRHARLVVIGSHGLGGFAGMLVGSAAIALAMHGHCPVAVVRGKMPDDRPRQDGPVLVGVDGSPAGDAAVRLAFEEASMRGTSLTAIHTWSAITTEGTWREHADADSDTIDHNEREVLAERLAGWQEKYPDVPVDRIVTRGRPVRTLLKYGENAQLIVLGSRGRGGFTGMLLGSTSQALVSHAPCPVIVARPDTVA